MEFDLVSIGDASLDVFIAPEEHEEFCYIDPEKCLVCFNYADKIPIREINFTVGGNAANNAVGASRLGVRATILLTVGQDKTGDQIIETLVRERVDTSFVRRDREFMSSYNTAVMYGGERTIFTYHSPFKYVFPEDPPKTEWAYLTSMGKEFAPFYTKVIEWARRNKVKIGFNPGSLQMKAGVDALRDLFPLIEVLFVNREEAIRFMGDGKTADEKQLLQGMVQLGVKRAVITDGPNGSWAYDGERYYRANVLPVSAYERTGAGDAFAIGCLSALIDGKGMDEAILRGTINSASVIGHIGPQAGLLTKVQLPEWFGRAKSSGVKVEEF